MIGRANHVARAQCRIMCQQVQLMRREAAAQGERGAIDASESAAIFSPAAIFGHRGDFWPWLVCWGGSTVLERQRKSTGYLPSSDESTHYLSSNEWNFHFKWINLNWTWNRIKLWPSRIDTHLSIFSSLSCCQVGRWGGKTKITTEKKEREIRSGFQPVSVCSPDKCQLISKKFRKKLKRKKKLLHFFLNLFFFAKSFEWKLFENFINYSWTSLKIIF